ncbi:dipeptidyl-peptidase IV [Flavobacteriaceae bacterium UJ101]|nr:dipeptidyl-peptidase IV [Flavobacteriaceae bacterium UJ101]
MRRIFVLMALVVSTFSIAQKQELTLSDAVLGYYKGLYPENLNNIQFVEGKDQFVYTSSDYRNLIFKDYQGKEVKRIALHDLRKTFSDLRHIPQVSGVDADHIYFTEGGNQIAYNYESQTVEKIKVPANGENQDFNKKQQAVAYTLENNLYIANPTTQKIVVTQSTDPNIVSGQAIHRSEFGITKGTFWSPAGNYLAFYQKDESHVTDYPLVDISEYPAQLKNIKYPMAGNGSERAKVGLFNMKTQQTSYLNIDTSDEHYLTNLGWSPDEKYIFLAEVNRDQNHMWLNRYDVKTGKKVNTLFEEKHNKWVEPEYAPYFLPSSTTHFLWFSERDGFMNLYQYTTKGKLVKQLTDFNWEVQEILGFDKDAQHVFISGADENGLNRHTYKVNLKNQQATLLTKEKGTHRTILNDSGTYLIDDYSTLSIPRVVRLINTKTDKQTMLLQASNPLTNYAYGSTELLELKANDGTILEGRLIKPSDFDPSKKYPVLVYVYGGPHAQLVTNSWLGGASLWMQQFAEAHDYLVFTLDNRGSAHRGFEFENVIHRQLGTIEVEDQMKGVQYLKSLPYVDGSRLAVHGWSFGGFMTSSLMVREPGTFNVGVAGGPVTDWKYYEVMYGERYMDRPEENPEGYKKARLGEYLDHLEGKLLLIHGSVDDVVVPQHSMTLLKEAVDKGVQIDFFTYPMHPHNVRGKDRVHLMRKVLDYVVENNK